MLIYCSHKEIYSTRASVKIINNSMGRGKKWWDIKEINHLDILTMEEKLLRRKCRSVYPINKLIKLLALTLTKEFYKCNILVVSWNLSKWSIYRNISCLLVNKLLNYFTNQVYYCILTKAALKFFCLLYKIFI